MDQTGLFKAIKYFGSQTELAKVVGVTKQAVSLWLNREHEIPYLRAARIVIASEGYIRFDDLVQEFTKTQKILYQANLYTNFPAIFSHINDIDQNYSRCSLYQDKIPIFNNPENYAKSRPILIDTDNRLITCICRLRAHQQAGHQKILVHPIHLKNVLRGAVSIDHLLSQFPISEKISIGFALEHALGNRQGKRNDLQLQYISPEVASGVQTRSIVAKIIGFKNHFLYVQAKFVLQKGVKELIQALDQQLVSISKAKKIAELPTHEQYQFLNTYHWKLGDEYPITH